MKNKRKMSAFCVELHEMKRPNLQQSRLML
jgi:hypothetical protein